MVWAKPFLLTSVFCDTICEPSKPGLYEYKKNDITDKFRLNLIIPYSRRNVGKTGKISLLRTSGYAMHCLDGYISLVQLNVFGFMIREKSDQIKESNRNRVKILPKATTKTVTSSKLLIIISIAMKLPMRCDRIKLRTRNEHLNAPTGRWVCGRSIYKLRVHVPFPTFV